MRKPRQERKKLCRPVRDWNPSPHFPSPKMAGLFSEDLPLNHAPPPEKGDNFFD